MWGRETIPLTPTTPLSFSPSSLDSAEMMTPRLDTNEFTTYKNELFEAPHESEPMQTPNLSSGFRTHPINQIAAFSERKAESSRNLGLEHHGVTQREHSSVKKEKIKHEYYKLYNKYEEVKNPHTDTQRKDKAHLREEIIAFARTIPNPGHDLHEMLQKTSGIDIRHLTSKINKHFNH